MHLLLLFCIVLAEVCGSTTHLHRSIYPTENYYGNFFQGDIFLRNGTQTLSMDRFATTHKSSRWLDGVVPYAIDGSYSSGEIELIRSAMDEFEKETCIKWVERTDEDFYVEIYNDMGCWSELGRMGGVQSLSLESPLCMKKGVIMHEMMHSVGFMHEQSRFDRDDYVRVIWDNIVSGMEPNFQKLSPVEIDDLGLDYDYRSIMHYRPYTFAEDRSTPTIKPSNHQVSLNVLGVGQENGEFTSLDVQKINKFYECSK